MYDVVLSGYYGFKNSGDEALLKSIISDLKRVKSDVSIMVLSNDPDFTKSVHGVDSVYRMNISEVKRVLKNTKLLISGGGSLIQDATSTKSLLYYLGIIKLAKLCGSKVMVYANGVGPISRSVNRRITKHVLNCVDYITLREPDSKAELEKMGVTSPEMLVTADPALGLNVSSDAAKIKNELFGEKPVIAVSVRSWQNYDEKIVSAISAFSKASEKAGYSVFLLPMQYSKDFDICKKIADKANLFVLPDEYSIEQITGLLSCCSVVVGMRLHAVVYAAASGSIPVGIVYDPKVESFMRYMGLEGFVDIKELTAESLADAVAKAISENQKPEIAGFKELAFKNAAIAVELLDK